MKLNTTINEIQHEELVNLFSTATYGDDTFTIEIPEECKDLKTKGEGKCWEDHIANVLLNGGFIWVYDNESYDIDAHSIKDAEVYGSLPCEWDNSELCVKYKLTLKDIVNTFSMILSSDIGNSNKNTDLVCLRENFENTFINESGDFVDAWNLLQACVFGEIIYG